MSDENPVAPEPNDKEPVVPEVEDPPIAPGDEPAATEMPFEPPPAPGVSFIERIGGSVAKIGELRGGPVIALAAAAAVFFVLTVLLALMVLVPSVAPFRLGAARSGYLAQRDVAITKVAVRFARNLLTVDYRSLDRDLKRLQQDSTGSFEKQLAGVRGSKDVVDALVRQRAMSTGEVRGVNVESVRGSTASVRVFLTRTVRNKELEQPRTSLQDVVLTLVKTDKGWKVDNVGG